MSPLYCCCVIVPYITITSLSVMPSLAGSIKEISINSLHTSRCSNQTCICFLISHFIATSFYLQILWYWHHLPQRRILERACKWKTGYLYVAVDFLLPCLWGHVMLTGEKNFMLWHCEPGESCKYQWWSWKTYPVPGGDLVERVSQ